MRLKDKVVIITGGGAGIGQAIALGCAREGAKVVIVDVSVENGTQTAATIEQETQIKGEAIFVQADISKGSDVEKMVAQTVDQYGRIDVLFNNAAIQPHDVDARAHELSEATWDHLHAVNLRGAWLCSKYTIPVMLQQEGGAIIYTASPTGMLGCAPGYTAYSTSKAGLFGLTRIMAVDYARDNIRVNAIVPGTTETPLIKSILADEQIRQALTSATPLGRIGKPEDVAGLAIFLASDEAQFCTGGFYMVDGGLTAV